MTLSAPVLLSPEHALEDFTCDVAGLDEWLKRRAYPNQVSGASRTYVAAEGRKVVGYYCLASGALALNDSPGSVRRNMPDPVPVVVLGRLTIDKMWQGKGLGAALLQDAVLRTIQAGGILGIRGLLVHTISDEAKTFYEHHGFTVSPTQPMTLILSLKRR
ncbi:MAG: GNAT family N-acetyltransferase [Desulfobacterales bacterium CG23_combo_of_CG06-09_8_20_14_all_51_8]|nr:MAG: GNAT family N-acetyltransferase [Desulfobacterales bacterium CG23_combo_of_CG06-09_8_20_14_all_51_8]